MFGASKLEQRVKELEEMLERIEHAFKLLQVEWTETYDKFRQLHWRVAKRARQLEDAEQASGDAEAPTNDSPPESSLSERQNHLQQQILARRARLRLPPQ